MNMGWRYKGGLLLLATVIFIWVTSAEVTQIIFEAYRHPFVLTYLGASLMVVLLPIVLLKEYIRSLLRQYSKNKSNCFVIHEDFTTQPSEVPESPAKINGLQQKGFETELGNFMLRNDNVNALSEEEEGRLLIGKTTENVNVLRFSVEKTAWEVAKSSFYMAPLWFFTEYSANAALANTSVASTTILSSTSALFTLIFGSLLGQDRFTFPKVVAVLVTITGVAMTTFGSTWAADDSVTFTRSKKHDVVGDGFGLLSAVLYGLFTGEEGEVDVQRIFGYIGLFTLLGLWWLVWPLMALGLEPKFTIPTSTKVDEILLANGMIGSVLSDYLWALSVVWTSPLIATLGMSLTIPVAMLSDMLLHGRHYSAIYMIGSAQVFVGFMIANLTDQCSKRMGI
ncbi:hypothetical protein O6H91_14G067500 [Diphasiastrum complanatum]|uniref:Uncharacterized protein n=1 Tax=Diphasiastrum complanatum TaxID=34168 RepID=A0ACC2BQG1_DIPCM|nr:hypothetical protein O6H91_Y282700 [Diphasiastrum complanatum]KAJ7531981.1 hypothetical protein O6H91_14G067500 [Diphasiastrum complanatum]